MKIALATLITLLLFSCTQEPSIIKNEVNIKSLGLNIECELLAKYDDKVLVKVDCSDIDGLQINETDYWTKAIELEGIIRVIFLDEDGFERYVYPISVSSFTEIVSTGNVRYNGTIEKDYFSQDLFTKITDLSMGTGRLSKLFPLK